MYKPHFVCLYLCRSVSLSLIHKHTISEAMAAQNFYRCLHQSRSHNSLILVPVKHYARKLVAMARGIDADVRRNLYTLPLPRHCVELFWEQFRDAPLLSSVPKLVLHGCVLRQSARRFSLLPFSASLRTLVSPRSAIIARLSAPLLLSPAFIAFIASLRPPLALARL